MLDPTGKPTPRLRARVIREELEARLVRLQELERWIKDTADQDVRARSRAGSVAQAIEHLQIAMAALLRASEE